MVYFLYQIWPTSYSKLTLTHVLPHVVKGKKTRASHETAGVIWGRETRCTAGRPWMPSQRDALVATALVMAGFSMLALSG